MGNSHILIASTRSATDYVNKTTSKYRQAWSTWPAGAGTPGSPAGLPRGNYAQKLVVRAGPNPDVPAVLRIPTQDRANHQGAGRRASVSRSGPGGKRHLRGRRHAGRRPPRQVAAATPSGAFPGD